MILHPLQREGPLGELPHPFIMWNFEAMNAPTEGASATHIFQNKKNDARSGDGQFPDAPASRPHGRDRPWRRVRTGPHTGFPVSAPLVDGGGRRGTDGVWRSMKKEP